MQRGVEYGVVYKGFDESFTASQGPGSQSLGRLTATLCSKVWARLRSAIGTARLLCRTVAISFTFASPSVAASSTAAFTCNTVTYNHFMTCHCRLHHPTLADHSSGEKFAGLKEPK